MFAVKVFLSILEVDSPERSLNLGTLSNVIVNTNSVQSEVRDLVVMATLARTIAESKWRTQRRLPCCWNYKRH